MLNLLLCKPLHLKICSNISGGDLIITVIFRSALKDFVPGGSGRIEINHRSGLTVKSIILRNEIKAGQVGLVLIEGKPGKLESEINDDSTIEIYPIFGGG